MKTFLLSLLFGVGLTGAVFGQTAIVQPPIDQSAIDPATAAVGAAQQPAAPPAQAPGAPVGDRQAAATTTATAPFSADELDQLLGPIALYPDPLLAQLLPAATLPTQIVMADRYLTSGGDPNQIDQQPWDASVQAIAHYPTVLQWMDSNLNWTTDVGQAFLNQQQDVMDSIQRLRTMAYNLGNLQSTPQQQVVDDGGYIEILPAESDIYVPAYEPSAVYYQTPYGTPFITFGIGCAIGGWLSCDFDWHHRNIIVWTRNHPRPADWWHERPDQRATAIAAHEPVIWRASSHPGYAGPGHGDRGWGQQYYRPHPVAVSQAPAGRGSVVVTSPIRPNMPGGAHPAAVSELGHLTPGGPAPHAPNGAFIGVQSASDTRTFSQRGQESMGISHPAAPHSAPPEIHSGGGGGGFHGGGGGGGSHGGGGSNRR